MKVLFKMNFKYIKRTQALLLIVLVFDGSSLHAAEAKSGTSEIKMGKYTTLSGAVKRVIKINPGLEAKRSQYNAALQIPDQVGALPEPQLILNALSLPLDGFSLTQTPMTQLQMGISQQFPYPGKLDLQEEVAIKESLASKESIYSNSKSLIRQVKHLWWQLFYIDRALDTVESNMELMEEFIDVAETKYTVGQGLQQEVLLAHVELAKLEDSKIQITGMRERVEADFNALLSQDAATRVFINKNVDATLPTVQSLAQLVKQAHSARPEIRQAKFKIEASEGRVELAEKDYYPDFKLGAVYGWRKERTGLANVKFSMNLPFNTEKRQDRKKDQRTHELLNKKYVLADLKDSVSKEIAQAMADFDRASQQMLIYQDRILPQAEQTVDSMLAGYQVNKVDFLNLLRSQLNLFNFQTQYWQALSAANQAIAALEYAVGSEAIYEQ